jgi:SAM-dependent methyltransferase
MADTTKWNTRYQTGDTPWETGQPSAELQRVLQEHPLRPCRALELGCGTGASSIWLAQQGFDMTGLDIAPLAIERAQARAGASGVRVRFLVADVLAPPELGEPFGFFFDRGCYHAVRRDNPQAYAPAVQRLLAPGALGLVLAGNAREPHEPGPPVVTEEQLRAELGRCFRILDLREFRFDAPAGSNESFLAWSCLLAN